MGQVGIPLFYLQGMGGGAVLKFRDLFNDNSQFWAWQLFKGATPAGKNAQEINGSYMLGINPGVNGRWETASINEAPRLFISPIAYPCEIKTRLDYYTEVNSQAGLFLAKSSIQMASLTYYAIVQRQKDGEEHGVCVIRDGVVVMAATAVQTLPIWFRIRLGGGAVASVTAYFDYSEDGLNWVNLYELPEVGYWYFSLAPPSVGIFVNNFSVTLAEVVGRFDFFQMMPKSIN
jgi:hypothetical protein